jgi:hypothetical protein
MVVIVVEAVPAVPMVENRRARRVLATEAGYGRISGFSVLAGAMAALGALAVLLVVAGGIATAIHGGSDFGDVSRNGLKTVSGVVFALAAFLGFWFGGYTAGRMARRSGGWNGFFVFVVGVILMAAGSLWVWAANGSHVVTDTLRNVGAPTTWHDWRTAAIFGGIGSFLATLVASVLGGSKGERWHTRLVTRAVDPAFGPTSAAGRVEGDAPVGRYRPAESTVEQPVAVPTAQPRVRRDESLVERPAEAPIVRRDESPVEGPADAPAVTSSASELSRPPRRRWGLLRRKSSVESNTEG